VKRAARIRFATSRVFAAAAATVSIVACVHKRHDARSGDFFRRDDGVARPPPPLSQAQQQPPSRVVTQASARLRKRPAAAVPSPAPPLPPQQPPRGQLPLLHLDVQLTLKKLDQNNKQLKECLAEAAWEWRVGWWVRLLAWLFTAGFLFPARTLLRLPPTRRALAAELARWTTFTVRIQRVVAVSEPTVALCSCTQ
jgi:hypothetical protein